MDRCDRKFTDKLISYEIREKAKKINGIICNLLTIESNDGKIDYYYNPKYAVNPTDFSEYEYGFWKFCIEKTKSLPLKSILDYEDSYIEIVALEIKQLKVDDDEFEIPNLPRVKSPEK